jgi:hypothetical protein
MSTPLKCAALRDRKTEEAGLTRHNSGFGIMTVVGTLRVIRHPESTIGTKTFSGFTEIRIEEP